MAPEPEELEALQRAAFGRSTPEERAAAEAQLAELQQEPRDDAIEPPELRPVRPWWAAIAVAAVLCAFALAAASFTVWTADSRRVFDRAPNEHDLAATWSDDFAPGGTTRWLGEFDGREVYGVEAVDGTVCLLVPLGSGAAVGCTDALAFSRQGIHLVSRTIEGDFAVAWGPTGGVRWGEYP